MNLIINADDFGVSEHADRTIIMLHKLGLITSATIIANGHHFNQAVNISKENPRLGVGVHLCLDGPFKIGKDFPSLISNSTGEFLKGHEIIKNLKRFAVSESEIYKEYCLQIEKVLDYGIRISHLDTHHHLHLYFSSLKCMISAAKRYGIKYIRTQKALLRKNQSIINCTYRFFHQTFIKVRLNAADGLYEPFIYDNSDYEEEYTRFSKLLKMKLSTVEIMLHPEGGNNPETVFFSSQRIINLLSDHKLINYHDLK